MKNRYYEEPKFDIVQLQNCDVITDSSPDTAFRGEDDTLGVGTLEISQ